MVALDLWHFSGFDPYVFLRPILFRIDPEAAHTHALKLLAKGLGPKAKQEDDEILHTKVCGLSFRNPIGLAAGFDKNAEAIHELLGFGFGSVEIGTITPQPQAGNPKPRLFRIPEAEAVINRMGFNSDGMDACLRRIKAWYDSDRPMNLKNDARPGLVGFNVGINKDCKDPAGDYAQGYKLVAPYADYVTINISSPNTPGLRDLQRREQLAELLQSITGARETADHKPPIFVKIAPDLTDVQAADIAEITIGAGVDALIVGNTTVTRPGNIPLPVAKETGGLSGKPLFPLSTKILAQMHKLTEGKIPLIGCGGVMSGADAYAKIRAGASLVQIYSVLVYKGPGAVQKIKQELATLLRRDGFKSVGEAVGAG